MLDKFLLYFQWLFELKVINIILTFQLRPKTTNSKTDVGPLFLGLGKEVWDVTFLVATSYARNSTIIMSTSRYFMLLSLCSTITKYIFFFRTHCQNWFSSVSLGRFETLNGKTRNVQRWYFRIRELYSTMNQATQCY